VSLFFHTEVLVCPKEGFSHEDAQFLDNQVANITAENGFLPVEQSWWNVKTANCVELGYGGAACSQECCSVPHGAEQQAYKLNERRAVIGNADTSKKSLYLYGVGGFDGNVAFHNACDKKCWSNWAGTDYNPLTNNCNTFTSTILYSVYGLSQKKPSLGPSDMVTVRGHCPASAAAQPEMPSAELLPQYFVPSVDTLGSSGSNYVFLQKFPLGGVSLFFHTEVLVCPKEGFSHEDAQFLDNQVANITAENGFLPVEQSWWNVKTANCVELGYGGAACSQECCSVPHGAEQQAYKLNERRAVIGNADTSKKSLYLYGVGGFDGNVAFHNACDKKCWSNWAGTDYNPLTNNCNTFTSTILYSVYGLSQKKPSLGPSDMVTVRGHCPASADQVLVV